MKSAMTAFVGLVAIVVVGQSAASSAAGWIIVVVIGVTTVLLIRRSRSGHGSAKSLQGLTRYRWADLPEDALIGLALGDIALVLGITPGGAIMAAIVVGVIYRICRQMELASQLVRVGVGSVAVFVAISTLFADDLCGPSSSDRTALIVVVFVSVGVVGLSAMFSFGRIGRTGPGVPLLDLPLLAYGLIELAIFAFAPAGRDLVTDRPGFVLAAIPVLLVLGVLAGANPALVLGLLGVGLGIAKLMLAAVESNVVANTTGGDQTTLCYGGWTVIFTALVFLMVSGITFGGDRD